MIEILALPFFQRALAVGLVLGILMAALGVFVVLRRMSFFADAIGHSALTGIAIGLLLHINPFLAALAFALLVALGIAGSRRVSRQSFDTLLGVFFAAAVSIGVILVSLTPGYQTDLVNILFGDILTVAPIDLALVGILAAVIAVILVKSGKALTSITFDESLARAEGIAVARHELIFLLLLAATIALSIKIVGVMLVTALLIIPAAAAQNFARSLGGMFVWSVLVAIISTVIGMFGSAVFNIPSGPAIIVVGTIVFLLSLFWQKS